MADPLSIAASVVGITMPALHGTRLLLKDLQELKDAPKTVKRLLNDVQSVDKDLALLQGIGDREWKSLGADVYEHLKATFISCTQACDLFRIDLQKWTRHSEDGKLEWRDKVIVGFFKKDQVKAITDQLQSCKQAINNTTSIATLHNSFRHSHMTEGFTEEFKKTMTTTQIGVKGSLTTADRQVAVVENKLEELALSSDDDEEAGSNEGKTRAVRQLEEEFKGVKALQKLLNELLSKSQEEAIAKAAGIQSSSDSITVTFGAQNSGIQAGKISGGVNATTFGGK